MKHIVYIIGHRSSDPFRIRNLILTTDHLIAIKNRLHKEHHNYNHNYNHNYEQIKLTIVVVEQDSKPTINHLLNPQIHYIFAYNAGEYNRCWAFNVGFKHYVSADYFYFGDNDIVMKNDDLIDIFHQCHQYSVINPYLVIHDTTSSLFEKVSTLDFNHETPINQYRSGEREHTCLTGGIVGMSRQLFGQLGGWDERFRGRGWEDYALTAKIRLMVPNDRLHIFKYPAVHLWHPYDMNNSRMINYDLNTEYSYYDANDYFSSQTGNIKEIGCLNKYIHESFITKYTSNETDLKPAIVSCPHCQNPHISVELINRTNITTTFNQLKQLVMTKHQSISDQECHTLIYNNLCEQHNCNLCQIQTSKVTNYSSSFDSGWGGHNYDHCHKDCESTSASESTSESDSDSDFESGLESLSECDFKSKSDSDSESEREC